MLPTESQKLYRFAQLDKYSLFQRLAIRAVDLLFFLSIRFVGRTTAFEIEGSEHVDAVMRQGKVPIYAAWHDRIFLGTYALRDRDIVFLTSQSFDGEYIARFLQRFGYGAIRGSSTRGGSRALVEMIRAIRLGTPMGFTLDGPKGPRYFAKSGALLLAKKTGNPVVPFIVEPAKFTTVNSWDRLQLPRPWSRAKVFFASPIYVGDDADTGEKSEKLHQLQNAMDELVERGRIWRRSL